MKLIVNKDRSVIQIGTWGTKNENDFEIVDFEFPEELEGYNKRIVYLLGGGDNPWGIIRENKAYITSEITSKENVKGYVWCTKGNPNRPADTDFRSQEFDIPFYKNEQPTGVVPTPQQVDGFNEMLTEMNAKIDEVDALEQTIGAAEAQRQENENTRISNESTRESNESTRQENEQTRQSQEADRERRTDEAIGNIKDKTAEYNANAEAKTTAFNNNATQKTNDFNSNYTQKVNDFNSNASTQKSEFNTIASSKTSAFNSNAETKTNAFNTNATNKTNAFNSNATEKTTTFDNNASTKTSEFNTNAESKTSAFNDNATQKTTNFDNNASEKTDEFNTNAQEKIDEYDEHIVEYQAQIDELQEEVDELSENMPWNTTEQATEIQVTDAAKYSRNKLELFGNTEQDNTKITYKCDGTETGDYYLTYNNIDYYFTMPTITEGDILVFNTTDLKLYLGDTEITTESTGTGTNLTFIPSPNPDYPQDIHVVTGNNSIGVQGRNLFDENILKQETNYNTYNSTTQLWTTNNGGGYGRSILYNATGYASRDINKLVPLTSAGTYTLKLYDFVNNTSYASALELVLFDNEGSKISQTTQSSNFIKFTINSPCYMDLCRRNNSGTISFSKVMLVQGDYTEQTLSNYVPYYHADYPINLGSLELCKIGNYQDEIFKNEPNNQHYDSSLVENAWYEYKKVAKYTVTEKTGLYYPSANHVYIRTGGSYIRSSASLGSYYIFENRGSGFGSMKNWHFGLEGTSVIHLKDNRFNSSGEFTDYFREHPLVIYLPYTTAKNIQITDETLISQLDAIYEHFKLLKGTNHITVTASDLAPYMQLSYMQDLPSKLNNLDSRLALLE